MENKIEVFILTFNRVEFLKESLNSILAQTMKTQITVVDNASDDGTCEYMSEMAERFDNVFYVRNEKNLGYNGNLQKAVSLAKKPYVMLFHDDDILHESYIALAN
ncbi:MAG: glycosyltransferase family A protein, partial [Opitutales bacterium]|nr:glycosyltransferase family A protein [Opitutales bacterium]